MDTMEQESQQDRDINEIREEIHRQALAKSQSMVYSLNNPYLNMDEKLEVELWYQLPGNLTLLFVVVAMTYSLFEPTSWKTIIALAVAINIFTCIANWYVYNKTLTRLAYYTLVHNYELWIFVVIAMGIHVFFGQFWKAVFILALRLILSSFLDVSLILHTILAGKYNMHPKYAFFKKHYGHTFPFEADLPPRMTIRSSFKKDE